MLPFVRNAEPTISPKSKQLFVDPDVIHNEANSTHGFNPIEPFNNAFKEEKTSSFWEDLTLNDVQTAVNQTNIQAKLTKTQLNNLYSEGYRKNKVCFFGQQLIN